jgi:hypothetical protein
MIASSNPPMFRVDATEALLTALTKLGASAAPGSLSSDEAFAIAALKFLTVRALITARSSSRAGTV